MIPVLLKFIEVQWTSMTFSDWSSLNFSVKMSYQALRSKHLLSSLATHSKTRRTSNTQCFYSTTIKRWCNFKVRLPRKIALKRKMPCTLVYVKIKVSARTWSTASREKTSQQTNTTICVTTYSEILAYKLNITQSKYTEQICQLAWQVLSAVRPVGHQTQHFRRPRHISAEILMKCI